MTKEVSLKKSFELDSEDLEGITSKIGVAYSHTRGDSSAALHGGQWVSSYSEQTLQIAYNIKKEVGQIDRQGHKIFSFRRQRLIENNETSEDIKMIDAFNEGGSKYDQDMPIAVYRFLEKNLPKAMFDVMPERDVIAKNSW